MKPPVIPKDLAKLLRHALKLKPRSKLSGEPDDILVMLTVEALGANAKDRKLLEAAAKALKEFGAKTKATGTAVAGPAAVVQELALLTRRAVLGRREVAAAGRAAGGLPPRPPIGRVRQYGPKEKVKLTPRYKPRRDAGPSPGGYDPARDLARRQTGVEVTDAQGRKLMVFSSKAQAKALALFLRANGPPGTGGLGVVRVLDPGNVNRWREVDLDAIWRTAIGRSEAAKRSMQEVDRLMAVFDGLMDHALAALMASRNARLAGNVAEAERLSRIADLAVANAVHTRGQASDHARAAFNSVRTIFWRLFHEDSALVRTFRERLGLDFLSDGVQTRGAPFFKPTPQMETEILTIEHNRRISDNPRRALDLSNYSWSPMQENSQFLEMIRELGEPGFMNFGRF
jgi:hypothetical protein